MPTSSAQHAKEVARHYLLRRSWRCARLEAGFCASPTGQPQDADFVFAGSVAALGAAPAFTDVIGNAAR